MAPRMIASVLLLLVVERASANGPPPWHTYRHSVLVFDFPNDGVEWFALTRSYGLELPEVLRYPLNLTPDRTWTLNYPSDFPGEAPWDKSQIMFACRSSTGQTHSRVVSLPPCFVHEADPVGGTTIRQRVECMPDGIRLTVLEERREWRRQGFVIWGATASAILSLLGWLVCRRRNRFKRTSPPPGT